MKHLDIDMAVRRAQRLAVIFLIGVAIALVIG